MIFQKNHAKLLYLLMNTPKKTHEGWEADQR